MKIAWMLFVILMIAGCDKQKSEPKPTLLSPDEIAARNNYAALTANVDANMLGQVRKCAREFITERNPSAAYHGISVSCVSSKMYFVRVDADVKGKRHIFDVVVDRFFGEDGDYWKATSISPALQSHIAGRINQNRVDSSYRRGKEDQIKSEEEEQDQDRDGYEDSRDE